MKKLTLTLSILIGLTLTSTAQLTRVEQTRIDLKLDKYRRDRVTSNVLILSGLAVMAASYYAHKTDQAQTPAGLLIGGGLVTSGLVVNLASLRHFKP
jgi:hypothetical protein